MSYIVTRPQWRALKSIAGKRRTVAATAAHVHPNTRSFLIRQGWIQYVSRNGTSLFYRITREGRRMLKAANKHYAPPKHRVQAAAEIKARKLKAAPNLGSGLVAKVDAGFEKLVNTPITKIKPRGTAFSLKDLERGIPRTSRFAGDRDRGYIGPPLVLEESSPDQVTKYPPNWIGGRDSARERRERVLKCIDAQRVPDLVRVLRDALRGVTHNQTETRDEHLERLARDLLHAARRPPTIAELMERARANAGIGGPDTHDQIDQERLDAGRRPSHERSLPTTTALERVALAYAAQVLERPDVFEQTVGALRFPGEAQDGYHAVIQFLKNGDKP